jgi:hypothetical protein
MKTARTELGFILQTKVGFDLSTSYLCLEIRSFMAAAG